MTAAAIGPDGEGLVFLLGLPRSGTTLLSLMLDNHPDIASPPEPWLMLALSALGQVPLRHPANCSTLGTAVDRFAGEEGRILAARAAARALYQSFLDRTGKRVFVDKTPRYALIPDFLFSVFPRARFVWLRRDPFDSAASYFTTWKIDLAAVLTEGHDIPELFDMTIGLDRLISFYRGHRELIHVVSYEQLTAHPREELANLLQYVDVEASDETLSRMTSLDARKRDPSAFGDHKIRETSAPHVNSIGTWRNVFDRSQLQTLIDAFGASRIVSLGYGGTVAELDALGVRQRNADAPNRYREIAEARLAAREDDITRATTHDNSDHLVTIAQARVHAALSDAKWMKLLAETASTEAAAKLAHAEAEIRRLRNAIEARDSRVKNLLEFRALRRLKVRMQGG